MSKSVTEDQTNRTKAFIDKAIEPRIKRLIEEANVVLRKRGIQVGAEVEWYIDKYDEVKKESEDEED